MIGYAVSVAADAASAWNATTVAQVNQALQRDVPATVGRLWTALLPYSPSLCGVVIAAQNGAIVSLNTAPLTPRTPTSGGGGSGAIIGAVVGVLLGLSVCGVAVWFVLARRRKRTRDPKQAVVANLTWQDSPLGPAHGNRAPPDSSIGLADVFGSTPREVELKPAKHRVSMPRQPSQRSKGVSGEVGEPREGDGKGEDTFVSVQNPLSQRKKEPPSDF